MFKYSPARPRVNDRKVPVRISRAARRRRRATLLVPASLALCFFSGVPALAATACCVVADIAANGQVTAREIDGTRTLRFQVTDAAVLRPEVQARLAAVTLVEADPTNDLADPAVGELAGQSQALAAYLRRSCASGTGGRRRSRASAALGTGPSPAE